MGEQRRRAERRTAAIAAGDAFVPEPYRANVMLAEVLTVDIPKPAMDDLRRLKGKMEERAGLKQGSPMQAFVAFLLESAVQRELTALEAEKHAEGLVQIAKPGDVQKIVKVK